jgi:hypothetical protein
MGALSASDVLTWWLDKAGKTQFLALDELPAGVTTLGAGLELYVAPGTPFPANVSVKMSLIPNGKPTPILERDTTPLAGADMLHIETQLPVGDIPPGSYTLRATVSVDGKVIGTNAAVIKKR